MRWTGLLMVFMTLLPSDALGHHTSHVSTSMGALGHGTANADGKLSNWIRLDLESAHFERELSTGSWRTLSFAGAWAPLDWLALTVNAPLTWLNYRETAGNSTVDLLNAGSLSAQRELGPSDMEFGILFRAFRTTDGVFTLLAGLSAELPTGSPDERLGAGHVELLPSLELITQLSPSLSLSAQARYTLSLEGDGHSHSGEETPVAATHGSLVTPHGEQEVITRLELDWLQDFGYLGAGAEVVYGIHGPEGLTGVHAHGVVGITLNETVLFTGGITLPFNDSDREEWKMHFGLTFRLEADSPKTTDCGCPEPLPAQPPVESCACGPPVSAPPVAAPPEPAGCCPEGECSCGPEETAPAAPAAKPAEASEECESCPGCND